MASWYTLTSEPRLVGGAHSARQRVTDQQRSEARSDSLGEMSDGWLTDVHGSAARDESATNESVRTKEESGRVKDSSRERTRQPNQR